MGKVGGSYSWNAVCDVCGFEYKANELRKRWDGLMVCKDDWEVRHPLDFYRTKDDTHKLPFIKPRIDTDDHNRVFEPYYDPSASLSVSTGTGDTLGTRFVPTADGYITTVNVWGGSDEPAEYAGLMLKVDYRLGIWDTSGTLQWSKVVQLTPGRWNHIPVVPNVRVLDTGDDWTVGIYRETGSPVALITPDPTVAAQDYLTYQGGYNYNSNAFGFPNTAATPLYLIDVSVRPD